MLVSIIVATYNSAKTLRRCLDSIVPQLGEDCELIIIDGGSKDGTVGIIDEYRDNIAYTVSEPDKGVYDAWNKGIAKAQGQWITFIGSDDELLPGAIDAYNHFFQINGEDYDIISAKLHFVKKDGTGIRDVGEPFSWQKLVNRKLSLAHPGMLHNRKCFEKIGLFDTQYKICGDSDFLQRLGKNVKSGYVNDYIVNMSEGGISDSLLTYNEGFLIRYRNHSVNVFKLIYMYSKAYLSFGIGMIKYKLLNINRK